MHVHVLTLLITYCRSEKTPKSQCSRCWRAFAHDSRAKFCPSDATVRAQKRLFSNCWKTHASVWNMVCNSKKKKTTTSHLPVSTFFFFCFLSPSTRLSVHVSWVRFFFTFSFIKSVFFFFFCRFSQSYLSGILCCKPALYVYVCFMISCDSVCAYRINLHYWHVTVACGVLFSDSRSLSQRLWVSDLDMYSIPVYYKSNDLAALRVYPVYVCVRWHS